MKLSIAVAAFLLLNASACLAQVGGNSAYGQGSGRLRAEQAERSKRALSESEKPTGNGMYVDAAVLMNVRADEYVAVFALSQEAATVAESTQKMNALVKDFTAALKAIGIVGDDIQVDFVAQNKTYGYEIADKIAKEKLVGFDLKKNISLRFKELKTLDKILIAAADLKIFDLVKVDYLVKNHEAVQTKLFAETARVLQLKAARFEQFLGVKLTQPPQIYVDKTSIYYPNEMYDSYVAQESEHIELPYGERERLSVQKARKGRTFYYNPLTANGFDSVVNPIVSEPVVQFTAYVRVRFEIAPKK